MEIKPKNLDNALSIFFALVLSVSPVALVTASEPTTNIVGGTDSTGNYPDAAALFTAGASDATCSGVLIAPDLILTAGHCIGGIDHVVVGSTDYSIPGGETIGVQSQTAYGSFNTYDIGVLQLSTPSTISPRQMALGCARDDIVDSSPVTIAGYGAIDTQGSIPTTTLKEANTNITDADCSDTAGCNPALQPYGSYLGGELVAGGGGIDACFGDSGGPLYLQTNYGAVLAGIVSRGLPTSTTPCGDGGIYTRPDAVESWIQGFTTYQFITPSCVTTLAVTISVLSGKSGSAINPNSGGVVPVVVSSISENEPGEPFDATQVDVSTVRFGPNGAQAKHRFGHIKDFDSDGDYDLVVHFPTRLTGIECDDDSASMVGETQSGDSFEGLASFVTLGCQ